MIKGFFSTGSQHSSKPGRKWQQGARLPVFPPEHIPLPSRQKAAVGAELAANSLLPAAKRPFSLIAHHLKAIQLHFLIWPDASFPFCNIQLLLDSIDAFQIGKQQPLPSACLHNNPVALGIQLCGRCDSLWLPQHIHRICKIRQLFLPDRRKTGIFCGSCDGAVDNFICQAGSSGGDGAYTAPQLAAFVD